MSEHFSEMKANVREWKLDGIKCKGRKKQHSVLLCKQAGVVAQVNKLGSRKCLEEELYAKPAESQGQKKCRTENRPGVCSIRPLYSE